MSTKDDRWRDPAADSIELTVVVDSREDLVSLATQLVDRVQLISVGGEALHTEASRTAGKKGWHVVRASTPREVPELALGGYVVSWTGVHGAEDNALQILLEAAEANPGKQGAAAASFDPLIVWRYRARRVVGRGLVTAGTRALAERSVLPLR